LGESRDRACLDTARWCIEALEEALCTSQQSVSALKNSLEGAERELAQAKGAKADALAQVACEFFGLFIFLLASFASADYHLLRPEQAKRRWRATAEAEWAR
jgi:hypothetical protein